MKAVLAIISVVLISSSLNAQHKYAYRIFDTNGSKSDYNTLVEKAIKQDVVLFGEIHNNPVCHWLQYELTRDVHSKTGNNLVLGAEMFESDNQLILNEYLQGLIPERNFTSEAKLWNNYETDYKPIVEFAKQNELIFIATNIPRRYAAMVNRGGFEALDDVSDKALKYIAPIPIKYDPELPGYKKMLEMTDMPGHLSKNLPKAQAVKDATMAHFIYENLPEEPVFLHFHGTYHSNNYEGIVWYLNKLDETMQIVTISTVEQSSVDTLDSENHGLADFIIVVKETMTKTY